MWYMKLTIAIAEVKSLPFSYKCPCIAENLHPVIIGISYVHSSHSIHS